MVKLSLKKLGGGDVYGEQKLILIVMDVGVEISGIADLFIVVSMCDL